MELTLIGEPIGMVLIVVLLADTLVHLWLIREERARRREQTRKKGVLRLDVTETAEHDALDAETVALMMDGATDDHIAAVRIYKMTPLGWKAHGTHALDTVIGDLADPERLPAYTRELGLGPGHFLAHYCNDGGMLVHETEFNAPA